MTDTQAAGEGGASAGDGIFSFGPFRLFPSARTLERDGVPLALGNRALDILVVLTEHAGEVVSHRDLLARVWRNLVVDPSNLRVHINGLRRALSQGDPDGGGHERYIASVVGQGYSFVAPVKRESTAVRPPQLPEYPCGAARERLVLPPALARMVGRDEAVRTIAADLIADRFVTIIGPGGIGKTTVALSVAHTLFEEFDGAVCFVDLSTVTEPNLVAVTIASKLGLSVQTEQVMPALMLCLRTLRILMVLDNCEHVVEATATLTEKIIQEAAGVHILATSREALRVEGEHAYWLASLESPPSDGSVRATEAMKFPAVKLFMERAAASGSRLELADADVSVIAGICGRLDGIPLAIEFAAGRVGLHGLAGTAELLKTRFGLQFPGRRTAVPRHKTLHALLDWSYGLLSDAEQLVLRRLAVFVGPSIRRLHRPLRVTVCSMQAKPSVRWRGWSRSRSFRRNPPRARHGFVSSNDARLRTGKAPGKQRAAGDRATSCGLLCVPPGRHRQEDRGPGIRQRGRDRRVSGQHALLAGMGFQLRR